MIFVKLIATFVILSFGVSFVSIPVNSERYDRIAFPLSYVLMGCAFLSLLGMIWDMKP